MMFSFVPVDPSFSIFSKNFLEPELAIVPRLAFSSSNVIPIPKSWMMNWFFSRFSSMRISRGFPLSTSDSTDCVWRSFSSASAALEMSSLHAPLSDHGWIQFIDCLLPNKDFLLGIERVGDNIQQTLGFRLEFMDLFLSCDNLIVGRSVLFRVESISVHVLSHSHR